MDQGIMSFLPMILIFAVFYFLMIRPQQKKQKEHKIMLDNLTKGDSIITSGGVHGKIKAIDGEVVSLEIANNVVIKMQRGFISTKIAE